jgi:hypothetical protein
LESDGKKLDKSTDKLEKSNISGRLEISGIKDSNLININSVSTNISSDIKQTSTFQSSEININKPIIRKMSNLENEKNR